MTMQFIEQNIPGVWVIEPKVFPDQRGYFMEAFKEADIERHIEGLACPSR